MYDIYFDLHDMHQVVDEEDDVSCSMIDEQFELEFLGFDFSTNEKTEKKSNGCVCLKCRELYPYAEPNQKDGTFKCYSCRHYG